MTKQAVFPHFTPKFSVGTIVFCSGPFHCSDGAFEDPDSDISYKKVMPMVITKIIAEVGDNGTRYQYKLRAISINSAARNFLPRLMNWKPSGKKMISIPQPVKLSSISTNAPTKN